MPAKGPIKIDTPLGEELRFRSMSGSEGLGQLFEYNVDVVFDENKLEAPKLLGQSATVHLEVKDQKQRHFNGYICGFAHLGGLGNDAKYRLTLRPWLWFLTRRTDCRIYQNKTIPDIIAEIFRDHGFTDFKQSLSGTYGPWEYCVQYRESYFNFVSRLMEQEGIYYYFTHEDGKHTMVMTDSYSGHEPFPGYEEISFSEPMSGASVPLDRIGQWSTRAEIQSGRTALMDYDFEDPKKNLLAMQPGPAPFPHADYEDYDYPGEYTVRGDGEEYAKVRQEVLGAQFQQAEGSGTPRGLAVGALFKLKDHHRTVENKEYLVVSARYTLKNEGWASGGSGDGDQIYRVAFTALDSKTPYRSPTRTPKPVVYGAQTAKVVGKAGEEIWTEEYNRVKVQFYWDRYGKSDENSSCWVRVSQAWAGPTWGSIHIPRIGQEVIVDFLEGDPDKPLITGRVYNKDNMPPYPSKPTQSGIKSRSTKGATPQNFNELRFEDAKGQEHIFMQAEKDHQVVVKNDETIDIGHDRKKTIKNDETTTVHGNRTETVDKDETITIHQNRTEKVDKNETIAIGGDEKHAITGNRTRTVGKDDTVTVTGSRTVDVSKDKSVHAHHKLTLTGDDKVTINSGAATITLKKDGSIDISGTKISIDGSIVKINSKGALSIEAGGVIKIHGMNVTIG